MYRIVLVLATLLVLFIGISGLGAAAGTSDTAPVYMQSELLAEKYHMSSTDICGSRAIFLNTSNTDPIGGYPIAIPPEDRAILRDLVHALNEKYGNSTVSKYLYDIVMYRDTLVAFLVPGAPNGLVWDLQALLPEAAERLGVDGSMVVILDLARGNGEQSIDFTNDGLEPYELHKIDPHLGAAAYDAKLGILRVMVNTKDPDTAFTSVSKLLEEKGLCGVPVLIYEIPQLEPMPLPADNSSHSNQSPAQANGSGEAIDGQDSTGPVSGGLALGTIATVMGAVLLVLAYLRG